MADSKDASILNSIKKLLSIPDDYDVYDTDVTIHINSAFATLQQLAVGPKKGYMITGPDEKWSDFIGSDFGLNPVITYVYIRVKLLFDPPETSYAREALKKQAEELEWRLNVYSEGTSNPPSLLPSEINEISERIG